MSLSIALRAVSVRRVGAWALRDINLRLRAGERWALIGDNGAGKTQLLKLIAGHVWPTPTGLEQRTYRIGRRVVDLIHAKPRMAYLGAELQDKYTRYGWDPRVVDLLATGLHRTDLKLSPVSAAERRRIDGMLRLCGLRGLATRRFSTLSYGQKRLALLARALCPAPDWLLLDELYNGLDTHYRRRIERILDIARAHGQGWIVAAHRVCDVPRGTRRFIELHAGRQRSSSVSRQRALVRLAGLEPPSPPAPRAPRRAAAEHRRRPLLVKLARASLYVGYRPVLRAIDWELREGEHWAIFGANGSGKTSFLKLLYGDLSPALGGIIERSGFSSGTPIFDWKRQVGYVSPELQADYAANVTVCDLVTSGRYSSIGLADAPTRKDRAIAARWLKFFKLLSLARRMPRELSYGQLRRALIARALASEPRILLLDEPLTGLDPRQRSLIKRLLERLMRSQLTAIIAVHHAEDLPRGMTHALRLDRGRAYPTDCRSAN